MRYIAGILFLVIAGIPYASMLWHGRGAAPAPAAGNGPKETLSIMSPHRREMRLEYSRGFHEWMLTRHGRNVDIKWLDAGGTSKILKEIESRYATSPGTPGIDLLFGGGIAPYFTAIERNWLARTDLPGDILAAIPATCAGAAVYDPQQRWFGVALSGFGILYNKPLLGRLGLPVPQTWEDLAAPGMLSWVSSADPRASGTVHVSYEIILQAYGFEKGWSLLTRICANVRNFNEGSSIAARDIATGDVAAGMVIDQYAQTVIASFGNDAVGFILPKGLTIVSADAIGRLHGAPAPELAGRFIEYALSAEGQRLLYKPAGHNGQRFALNRLPVRLDLYTLPGAPPTRPYSFEGGIRYDERLGMRRWKLVNDLVGTWLIDSHDDLVAAWQAVIKCGLPPHLVARLCASPIPASDLNATAEQLGEPRKARETIKQWAGSAKARYRAVIADANREI